MLSLLAFETDEHGVWSTGSSGRGKPIPDVHGERPLRGALVVQLRRFRDEPDKLQPFAIRLSKR